MNLNLSLVTIVKVIFMSLIFIESSFAQNAVLLVEEGSLENPSPEVVKNFDRDRVALVELRRGGKPQFGSGVYIGNYDLNYRQKNGEHIDLKAASIVVTNYHVNGPFPNAAIKFRGKEKELRFSTSMAYCSIVRDICLLVIDPKSVSTDEKKNFLTQSRLSLVSAKNISENENLYFMGKLEHRSVYSKGHVDLKILDLENYFKTENKVATIMLSTTGQLRPGMSGGATINNFGELLGINSFFISADVSVGGVKQSVFLPTDWIVDILDDLASHDLRYNIENINSENPFWFQSQDGGGLQVLRRLMVK